MANDHDLVTSFDIQAFQADDQKFLVGGLLWIVAGPDWCCFDIIAQGRADDGVVEVADDHSEYAWFGMADDPQKLWLLSDPHHEILKAVAARLGRA